jgi:hypothetical protein
MLEKILKFLPIYFVIHVLRYTVAFLQIPHSYVRALLVKPAIIEINDYSDDHKFIFIYGSIEPRIGESSTNILSTVKDLGGYVILVTNSSQYIFDDKAKTLADVFIDNKDTGWDFSQYKRASQYIYSNLDKANFSKVIYANDSVFYLPKTLKNDLVALLNNEYDVGTFFDGLGRYNYHFASWFISVGRDIFLSEKIRKFWNKFFEVKNKFYAIVEGEYSFSKTLFSLLPRTFVSYNGLYLCSLKEMNLKHLKYMSPKLHDDFFESRDFMYNNNELNEDPLRDYVSHSLSEYPLAQTFAPLLLEFSNLSCIKKDLFWNEFQSISSIYFFVSILDQKINKNYSNLIKAYFIKRGTLSRSNSYVKALNFLGIR